MSDTKFPKMHIATSVVNRIMNLQNNIRPIAHPNIPTPVVADSEEQGKQLDQQLAQPNTDPVAEDQAVVQAAASGKSPLDGLIDPQV